MASAATSKQPIFASNLPTAHVVGNFLRDIILLAFDKKVLAPPCKRCTFRASQLHQAHSIPNSIDYSLPLKLESLVCNDD
jgi:hypothetical protein